MARRDGRVVGWVSLGPRDSYPRLLHSKVYAPVDDRPVWSVVCFVVSRLARGQGIGGPTSRPRLIMQRELAGG